MYEFVLATQDQADLMRFSNLNVTQYLTRVKLREMYNYTVNKM